MHPEPSTVKSFSPPTTEGRIGLIGNPERKELLVTEWLTAISAVTVRLLILSSKGLLERHELPDLEALALVREVLARALEEVLEAEQETERR